ncbi:GNAT family N-acetyltransferase [Terriglobus tenax]|uniref:GNAT family N-acetyltransferase n=1 Tax=Terriglobus tenax TaxID=1111115 RepID=UPI0021DFF22F|nr:GNAT family N-acetyltransferase [Terriglobus tenax]
MSAVAQIDLLDLRHYSGRQLRALLEEEARQWKALLEWDYNTSVELLLQYLDARILPGYVALDNGNVSGYTFSVYEGDKAVVGDAFAQPTESESAQQIEQRLLTHLIEMLQNSPQSQRIESQLLLHPAGSLSAPFLAAGFRIYPRLFLHCDLDHNPALPEIPPGPALPEPLVLRPWVNAHFQPAGELIHRTYRGHLDSSINDQYRSLHGSLRFLHNIVRFPGCGAFDTDSSWVIADPASGVLEGMVLCSRVCDHVAHITQLCVAPQLRGRGYGRMLIQQAAAGLRKRGFEAITLTVTEENTHAVRLYQDLGFRQHHRFDAMVWDKRDSR